jgi:putative two-component system response regulator
MSMIRGGQCGSFNPTLLACFESIADQVRDVLQGRQPPPASPGHLSARDVSQKLSAQADLSFSTAHVLKQLELEKARCRFLADAPGEMAFTYYAEPPFLELSPSLADLLELPASILEPMRNEDFLPKIGDELFRRVIEKLDQTSYHQPDCQLDCQLPFLQSDHQCRLVMRSLWDGPENPKRVGFVGRVVDYTQRYTRMDRSRNAAVEYALGKLVPRGCQWFSATSENLPHLIQALRFLFDAIRLVNVEEHQEFIPDEQGRIAPTDRPCYNLWSRGQQCEKCISHNVVSQKSRVSKFEFVGDDVYHVVSAYIEVDGQPRALEMVTRVNFDSLDAPTPSTDKEVLEAISIHGNRLYLDPLTGAYNRWYYDEALRGLTVAAVAMLDVDHFKSINDEFSHQAGDLALTAVAKVLLSCVRSVDSVVRYGGDEFALVFQAIPQDIFHLRLEQIRSEVECIRLEEFPDIRLSVSIGGVYGSGTTQEMLNTADLLMYQAKKKRNSVCLGETDAGQKAAQ